MPAARAAAVKPMSEPEFASRQRCEMPFDQILADLLERSRVPFRGMVLVDQDGPDALEELGALNAVLRHTVFHSQHLGEARHDAAAAPQSDADQSGSATARERG